MQSIFVDRVTLRICPTPHSTNHQNIPQGILSDMKWTFQIMKWKDIRSISVDETLYFTHNLLPLLVSSFLCLRFSFSMRSSSAPPRHLSCVPHLLLDHLISSGLPLLNSFFLITLCYFSTASHQSGVNRIHYCRKALEQPFRNVRKRSV